MENITSPQPKQPGKDIDPSPKTVKTVTELES